jgi:hypothetical protein
VFRRERLLRRAVRTRLVVTLLDGATFDGLVEDVDRRVLVLVDAGALDDKGGRRPVDGSLYLERARVAYMQAPDGRP